MGYVGKFLLCICLGVSFVAFAEKINGTIIFSDNKEEEVIFDLPVSLLGDLNYVKLQEKVKYYDSFEKKKLLRPENAKEISFSFNGDNIRMISIPKSGDLNLGSILSSSASIFLKLELEGAMRMFYYEFRQSNPGMVGPTGGMSGGYTYTVDKYLLQKPGGGIKWPRGLSFRKDMIEYFSDCPELADKIEKKEFKRDDMLAIAKFYNKYCK